MIEFRNKTYKDVEEVASEFGWPVNYAQYKIDTFSIDIDAEVVKAPKIEPKQDNSAE